MVKGSLTRALKQHSGETIVFLTYDIEKTGYPHTKE